MPAFSLTLPAANVVITATTATIWSLLAWHIRLFIRLKIRGPFSWDDIFCTIATVFAVLQSSLTVAQTCVGLGHHVDSFAPRVRDRQHRLGWVATFFFLLALGFSMLSVCFLIERVTKRTNQARIAYGIAVLTVIWTVGALFVVGFQCRLPTPWITRPQSRCIDLSRAWLGIIVTRCLLELANMIAAVVLLWNVRMPWKTKLGVLAAFLIRLLVIPPTITRFKYIDQTLRSSDWSYSRIEVVIITQIEMHISVILATVPCIRSWLNAFESGGLQAPAEVRRASRHPTPVATKLAPLLPIAMTAVTDDTIVELSPGIAGHRKRVEAWPVQFFPGDTVESKTVTTVEHDPVDAREMARKASRDSQGSRGITRTTSFSVKFQEIDGHMKQQREQASPYAGRLSRTFSSPSDLYDAGGLLEEVPRARLKSRTGSMASV